MFWRFGGYANISTLNNILEKPDVTLEEVLDESDLLQELKASNSKLIEYLREENILRKLLEYVTAPETLKPDEDEAGEESGDDDSMRTKSLSPFRRSRGKKERSKRQDDIEAWEKADKTRTKLAYTSCEVLSSETWSIVDSLVENQQYLRTFWEFLRREAPLDPTAAGYFSKINETLLDRRTEDMVQFLQSIDNIVPAMLAHIDCAAIMDLLLKIISMEKSEGGAGVVDWLQSQDLIPKLLEYLNQEHTPATQTAAGDFMKAIVTISANASQNEQSCIGPNNLTRQLVSKACMDHLLSNMLHGGNPLTVGVGLIIEIIRKNNSDYDPDVGGAPDALPTSSDPIYLGVMLRSFAERVPDFMALLLSNAHTVNDVSDQRSIKRRELGIASGKKIEPLGFDRFKTCELMAELLHCSNMGLLNERGSEAFIMQRNEERERLRMEGRLRALRPPDSAVTEFSEGSTQFTNGVSPINPAAMEQNRRLGIANHNSEEDGFEDVGHPAEDVDEIKDEFDDKSPFEIEEAEGDRSSTPEPISSLRPRLDLDEEFVDEPLTSPRLEAADDKDNECSEVVLPAPLQTNTAASPTSPTSGITSGVGGLDFDADVSMTNSEITKESAGDAEDSRPQSDVPPQTSGEAPPLPQRSEINYEASAAPESSPALSPHPEDRPAPLFASGADDQKENQKVSPDNLDEHATGDNSVGSINTIHGEEGDTHRSLDGSGVDQSFEPHFEYDVDGRPMVGDSLKIMFVEHQVVPTILDFFFRFPWNNFLHNVVYDVVQQVFNGPMDRGFNRSLAIDLFQTGQITERIIEGQAQSDEAQRKSNMRLGYMGHLTLVAEEVVKFSDRHSPEVLSQIVLEKVTSQQWNEYVENTLSQTRERDNAILGGVRPDLSLGPRQAVLNAVNAAGGSFGGGASSALANAGLNGSAGLDSMDLASNGSATSTGGFGLSSGSLLSGFGSSSDEEDEEMEEVDDGEAPSGEPLLSSHPSINSQTSPPTDPPPAPPPLNLPPSRARRQLAARLAMHSQKKADAEAPTSNSSEDATSNAENTVSNDEQTGYDEELQSWNNKEASEDQEGTTSPTQANHASSADASTLKDDEKKRPGGRQLDLDDFANSPAADADDTASNDSGEDFEMRVAMG